MAHREHADRADARGGVAVDVRDGEPGVGERAARRLDGDLVRGLVRGGAARVLVHAHHRDLAAKAHR
jgi:hypothetical protein